MDTLTRLLNQNYPLSIQKQLEELQTQFQRYLHHSSNEEAKRKCNEILSSFGQ